MKHDSIEYIYMYVYVYICIQCIKYIFFTHISTGAFVPADQTFPLSSFPLDNVFNSLSLSLFNFSAQLNGLFKDLKKKNIGRSSLKDSLSLSLVLNLIALVPLSP